MCNPGTKMRCMVLFLLITHPDEARGMWANLTGDLASIEDGFGGKVGPVRRQRVDVDGVAPLVPPEEALPERRQRQRAAREEHEGHLGHAPERVPPHPRGERRAPEQLLVRHRVLQPLRGGGGGGDAQPRPEQRGRRHLVPMTRHEHAGRGQPQAEQQEHLEHPPREHPVLPLPRLLRVVLHGCRACRLQRGSTGLGFLQAPWECGVAKIREQGWHTIGATPECRIGTSGSARRHEARAPHRGWPRCLPAFVHQRRWSGYMDPVYESMKGTVCMDRHRLRRVLLRPVGRGGVGRWGGAGRGVGAGEVESSSQEEIGTSDLRGSHLMTDNR
jgi:hypothetical protein